MKWLRDRLIRWLAVPDVAPLGRSIDYFAKRDYESDESLKSENADLRLGLTNALARIEKLEKDMKAVLMADERRRAAVLPTGSARSFSAHRRLVESSSGGDEFNAKVR